MPKFHTYRISKLFLLLLLIGFALSARAQMSGSYTIDSTVAASSTNFKNWYSFWRSLQGQSRTDGGASLAGGISASVVVTVKSDLTDTSKVKFPAISGTSSTKTITINGNGKVLTYAYGSEAISFQGGDYITIKNLTIRSLASGALNPQCIRFYNNSDYNTIQNCTLEFTNISSGSKDGSAFIAFCSSPSSLSNVSATLTGSFNQIKGNLCRTTNTNSPGPAFGFVMNGSSSGYTSTAQNNTFDSNTIQNFYYVAVQALNGNGNQFLRNNISRANASSKNCNSSLYGFNLRNSYASGREFLVNGNYVHDLPFAGAAAAGGVTNFYGFYALNNIGNSSYSFGLNSNIFKNIYATDAGMIGYLRNTEFGQITQNTLDKLVGYNTVSFAVLWEIVTGNELNFSGNIIQNCNLYGKGNCVVFLDSFTATKTGFTNVSDILVQKNTFAYDAYLLYTNNGNWKVLRNKLINNLINGGNGGYLYSLTMQEFESAQILNNLIAGNIGEDGVVGIYAPSFNSSSTNFDVHQNTIYLDGSTISSGAYELDGMYLYPYYHTNIKVSGNIIDLVYGDQGVVMGIDCSASAVKLFNNNSYYTKKFGSETWFMPGGNSASDFAGWMGLGFAGSGESFMDPKFTDITNYDFHPKKWLLQNNVATQSINPKDIDQVNRNPVNSDRGAYEQIADIKAVSSTFSIAGSVCSGTSKKMSLKIQNLFSDTVYDFNVSFAVNGGAKTTQKVTKKLAPNDTFTVNFTAPLVLNKWGNARIAVFVDVPDDKTSNDSIIFTTKVNPAPGGRSFTASAKPTKAIYKGSNPFAVTYPGQPIYFTVNPPRSKTNSAYGSTWNSSVFAITAGGVALPGSSLTNTNPVGGNDQEVKFLTNDMALQDTMVKVCVKTTDLGNGCDTVICQNMFISSIVVPKFSYSSLICGNDTAKFVNNSSIKNGGMRFHWDFGTGKSADTSNQNDPFFQFPGAGTYKVKLTAYTMPYGFQSYDSAVITVASKPVAKFTRTNACEGDPVKFTNQTTPTNATYDWDFGDGSTHSTATNPSHTYLAGQYTAKLKAKLNGCYDSFSLKVLEYAKPKAGFTKTSGICDNENVVFNNTTTYTGVYSSYWYFPGNKTPITTNDATYKFTAGGSKNVKLVIKSDFGCYDSVTNTISLKSAPIVSFTNTEGCLNRPTVFKNNTPDVPLAVANYFWTFGDGTKSTAKSPSHSWASTGPRDVKLKVVLDNGCIDSSILNLVVKNQAKAAFSTNAPVCSGSSVSFTNQTTWPAGNITYYWDLADGNNTITGSPQHVYKTGKTTTYQVMLIAKVDSACGDTAFRNVVVNQLPSTCLFRAKPDYAFGFHGIKLEPTDSSGNPSSQSGVTYLYSIPSMGINNTSTTQFDLPSDGTYNITQCAITNSNPPCTCCTALKVVMDRTFMRNQQQQAVSIFPNPNNGSFQIQTGPEFGAKIQLQIISTSGALVKSFVYTNNGKYLLNAGDIAAGMYAIRIISGSNFYTTLLEIQK